MTNVYKCCPFQSTPGRFNGTWTKCIHGLTGRRNDLLKELQQIEDQIWKFEVEACRIDEKG